MNDEKRYEQARESGRQARRVGKKRMDNPYRGNTQLVRDLHEYWDLGWMAEDSERKAAA